MPASTANYVYVAAWHSGRAAAWHAAGTRVEPRCEHFFSYQYYSAHGCKIQPCTPWYSSTAVDVYLYGFCFKIKEEALRLRLIFFFYQYY
jgi:hypothetical protein